MAWIPRQLLLSQLRICIESRDIGLTGCSIRKPTNSYNMLLHFYRKPALLLEKKDNLVSLVKRTISPDINDIQTEYCFNIDAGDALTRDELEILRWLLSETFEPENFSDESFLTQNMFPPTHPSPSRGAGQGGGEDLCSMPFAQCFLFEVGPRMDFT